jgi:hypothetical protein
MAAYATYTQYTTDYLGTAIASTDFSRLALRASAVIDQITFDRTAPIVLAATETDTIDRIKMATCAVAEELQKQDANGGADGIQSESVGAYSVTYIANAIAQMTNNRKLINAARVYLGSTGLLYPGFASDEYGCTISDED